MRTQRYDNRRDYENAVNDLAMSGYDVEKQSDDRTVLSKSAEQSILVHVILLILTIGIGNVIYYLWKKGDKDEVLVRLDAQEDQD